jgi:hypothetical protein
MHGLVLLAQIPFVLRIPELLAEPWFKYLLLPVCGLLAGAVVKSLYRKDDREWAKEDFAWGPDLVTSACVMMLLLTADRSVRYVNLVASSPVDKEKMLQGLAEIFGPFFVCLMNVAILILLTLWIRRRGWQDKDQLLIGYGIVGPWVVGLLSVGLSFYFGVL